MPIRATKRGVQRTPLDADADVLVCGASFAGLTVARELANHPSRPRVLLVDRYEVGERQTSACAAPTEWLEHLGLGPSIQQTFGDLLVHARERSFRWDLPFTFSTFDYRRLCGLLLDGCDAQFETAKVNGRTGDVVHTDRGDLRAPLVVDALGWRRVLDRDSSIQPPEARLSRGLEIHPHSRGDDLELWLDPRYIRAGYSWSFPADGEMRVGVGSFDPRDHVREPTERLAQDVGLPAERWQGNWIPHQIRPATGDGVFFVGDSAGHCLPTTAEGIRPAFHFALALGARAARGALRGAHAGGGAGALRRVLRGAPLEVRRAPARAGRGREAQSAPARDAPGAHADVRAATRHVDVPALPRDLPAGGRRARRGGARRVRARGRRRGRVVAPVPPAPCEPRRWRSASHAPPRPPSARRTCRGRRSRCSRATTSGPVRSATADVAARFQAGSVSKALAAVGALRLAEATGRDLDAPLVPALGGWRPPGAPEGMEDGITLRRVLSHTAGLSIPAYPGIEPGAAVPDTAALLAGEGDAGPVRLAAPPGRGFRYSGGGFTVAQRWAELVTGEPFGPWMDRTVLAPLGMAASTFAQDPRPGDAAPHDAAGAPLPARRFAALAAAGLWTTAADLARFAAALGRGDLPAVMAEPAPETGGRYGLGLELGAPRPPRHRPLRPERAAGARSSPGLRGGGAGSSC